MWSALLGLSILAAADETINVERTMEVRPESGVAMLSVASPRLASIEEYQPWLKDFVKKAGGAPFTVVEQKSQDQWYSLETYTGTTRKKPMVVKDGVQVTSTIRVTAPTAELDRFLNRVRGKARLTSTEYVLADREQLLQRQRELALTDTATWLQDLGKDLKKGLTVTEAYEEIIDLPWTEGSDPTKVLGVRFKIRVSVNE